MVHHRSARAVGACVLLCALASWSTIAKAQLAGEIAPPERESIDQNGVNVATGTYRDPHVDLTIGSGPGALSVTRVYGQMPYQSAFINVQYLPPVGGQLVVNIDDRTETFTRTSSGYNSVDGDGATLTGGTGGMTLTLGDGTQYVYGYIVKRRQYTGGGGVTEFPQYAYLSSIGRPTGAVISLTWVTGGYCTTGNTPMTGVGEDPMCQINQNAPAGQSPVVRVTRLQSMSSNAGYGVAYVYQNSSLAGAASSGAARATTWQTLTGASGSNSQGGSGTLPSVSYAQGTSYPSGSVYNQTNDVTDGLGRTWRYTKQYGGGSYEAVRRPGSSSDNVRVNLTDGGTVTSVVRDGATWIYSYAVPSSNVSTLTVTDPTNRTRKYTSDLTVGLPTRVEDEYGRTTIYTYDTSYRLKTGTTPGGQVTTYNYDTRGNLTSTVVTQAGGGATLSSLAAYPPSCSNTVSCNEPTTTTDARGQVTTYSYDPTHGGVTAVTSSAVNGVSPQTRYGYTQVGGVYLPTSVSACRTSASCAGGADEVKTTTSYNANLLPTSVTSGAGDGSLSATTAATYTAAGDVATVDGPLAGTVDTTRYYYDAARQRLGVVGPDPDGGGPRHNQAARIGYDGWGRATTVSLGTASDQSDAALANMTVLQVQTSTLDDAGRTKSVAGSAGSTIFSRVDTSYDAAGRAVCSAVRMNQNALGAASDACTVGADAGFGPDRVSLTQYSPAGSGQPVWTSVTSAYGTSAASTESVTYTATGKTASVTDGNGNVTSYGYDGFDRATTTTYPGGSYEQLGYDANGNVTSRRLRDGQTLNYAYDVLNRRTNDYNPGTNVAEVNVTYSYDNIGNVLRASDGNGWYAAFEYDALGRATRAYSNVSSNALQYDLAGRRTRQTWGDGFYVTYDYDTLGETTAIHENGGFVLASFDYDDLGRRTSLTRGNGTVTSYAFDPASRLTSLTQDLAGTSRDLTLGFAYNPAAQITSRTSSNDAYAFTQGYNTNRGYSVNALNQYTASGSVTPTYDARGNLTQAGTQTYQYNTRNQLFQTGTSGQLFYRNPAGTLSQILSGGGGENIDYVGSLLATEFDAGNGATLRRYVYGPGSDEPLVWYEGSGTGDRRYLHADERGSVIAVTNDAGNAIAVNTYDEYGIPGSGNIGRFQYTGQKWIAELGMYDYKARMYSPTLGRFLQTDPIGYGDGLNWYNYVGSDPINFTDPSGLQAGPGESPVLQCPPGQSLVGTQVDTLTGATIALCAPDIVVTGKRRALIVLPADPLPRVVPASVGGTGNAVAAALQNITIAQRYTGDTFCKNATVGNANRFNPFGRINSGKTGGFDTALADIDRIASANGISRLGSVMTNFFSTSAMTQFLIPTSLGDGWSVGKSYWTGDTTISNGGLGFRYNAESGKINIDIPAGSILPNGGQLAQNETCHYRR